MYGEKANAMIERLQQATWLPPYDDTLKEVLEEIDQLHSQATEWLQCVLRTFRPSAPKSTPAENTRRKPRMGVQDSTLLARTKSLSSFQCLCCWLARSSVTSAAAWPLRASAFVPSPNLLQTVCSSQ